MKYYQYVFVVVAALLLDGAANILSPQIRVRSFFNVLSLIIIALRVFV